MSTDDSTRLVGTTISHYRIVDHVGDGGMGVVYRAEDTRLGRTVALKFLPPQLLHDDESKERFLREAKAASALDHPNVCTIFEIDETDDGQLFIAMAYYQGETLKECLDREAVAVDEAVEIVRQIASGLMKTHELGLIHRDIKPANVFLTEDSGSAGHVKLLDFGLAKGVGDVTVLTQAGSTLGTPAYMSPEQTRGEELDARTDLWSLGVMLYELLGGQLPFSGNSVPALIYAINASEPEPLDTLRPGVPAELQAVVSKLLRKRAEDRYASCRELVADLERFQGRSSATQTSAAQSAASGAVEATQVLPATAMGTAVPSTTPMTAMPAVPAVASSQAVSSKRGLLITAAVVAVALLGVLAWSFRAPGPPPAAFGEDGRPSIAVCFFDNPTGDPDLDWLRTGLADMLVTDLSQSPDLEVLSTSRMYQVLEELDLLDEKLAFTVASDVAERAGVDLVVLGSVVRAGDVLRIDIKIQEAGTGKLVASKNAAGEGDGTLFSLVDDLSFGIRQELEMPATAGAASETDLASVTTSSIEAYRAYVKGTELHWKGLDEEAVPHYQTAIEIDPEFAVAYARLASTYSNLGWPTWMEYAEKALEHAERLPPDERLYVEGVYYATKFFRLNDSIAAYEQAMKRNPNNFSARNNLALRYAEMERYEEAVELTEASLRMGDPFQGLPTNLAFYYAGLGKLEKAEEILTTVADPRDPGTMSSLGRTYLRRGEYGRAAEQLEKAWSLEQNIGTLMSLCSMKLLQDDPQGALQVSERPMTSKNPVLPVFSMGCRQFALKQSGRATEAAAILERMMDAPFTALAEVFRVWAGDLELQRGRPEAALQHLAPILENEPEFVTYILALDYSALAELELGRTDAARDLAAELGALAEELGYPREKRRHLRLLAQIDFAEGHAEAAIARFEEVVAMLPARALWARRQVPDDVPLFYSLAEAYRAAGEMERSAETLRRILDPLDGRWFYPIIYVRSLYLLGEYHRERGEDEQAAEYFRRFLRNWDGGELEPEWVDEAKRFLKPSRGL